MADQNQKFENVPEPAKNNDWRKKIRDQNQQVSARNKHDDEDDYDDFSDLEMGSEYDRMTIGMRLMYFLLILGIFVMVGYLVLIVLFPDKFGSREWIGTNVEKEAKQQGPGLADIKSFKMGGIHMGVTPDQAKKVYSSMLLEPNPNAGPNSPTQQTGRFEHHGGDYEVSFRGPERGNRAYIVRSVHAYPKISYLELLTELSNRFGKPGKSDCGASEKVIGIECKLYWRTGQTLINAEIVTAAPKSGEAKTTLTVTARDTRPDRYFRQLESELKDKKAGNPRRNIQDIAPAK